MVAMRIAAKKVYAHRSHKLCAQHNSRGVEPGGFQDRGGVSAAADFDGVRCADKARHILPSE